MSEQSIPSTEVEALDLYDLAQYVLADAPDADLSTICANLHRWVREAARKDVWAARDEERARVLAEVERVLTESETARKPVYRWGIEWSTRVIRGARGAR